MLKESCDERRNEGSGARMLEVPILRDVCQGELRAEHGTSSREKHVAVSKAGRAEPSKFSDITRGATDL